MKIKPKFVYYDIRRKQSVCLAMYTHENDVDTQVLEVSMLDNGEPIELDTDYTYSAAIVNRETKALINDSISCELNDSGNVLIPIDNFHTLGAQDLLIELTITDSTGNQVLVTPFPLWIHVNASISTTSTPDRDANIARAAELINGTIIEPGRNFSFNNVVGARTKKNGFFPAKVYAYGKEEEGYGGGVCQVSSTMYWAAIRANLEIVKREQHGLKVGYTDLGFDATVNYDGRKIDFAFKNNTGSKLYIITKVMLNTRLDKNHYVVICDLYGAAPEPGVTYDIVAYETEIPMPEPTVVPDKKAEHVVYTDETYTEQGRVGTQVDSFKVKYVNGEEVERTPLYTDIYAPVQTVTYVGVSERPLPSETPWYP